MPLHPTSSKRLSKADRLQNKLHGRGPFKLKLGSRVFRYRDAAEYSEARMYLSLNRFRDVGEMVDGLKARRVNPTL